METQAYFENIQYHIKKELNQAKNSIQIAVAWFTDEELFDILCQKAEEGKTVELIIVNDEINNNSKINYELLNNAGGKVWMIAYDTDGSLMHNKFCIIDHNTIITGSYNWSYQAQKNYENITVIRDDPELAKKFYNEFFSIGNKFFGDKEKIDIASIIKRLEIIKNAISLEDKEDIEFQLNKIKKAVSDKIDNEQIRFITDLIILIERQNYSDAVAQINDFVNKYRQITVFVDPEISALKLEIKSLELQISSLDDEKTEIEKLTYYFEVRHNEELGEIILKQLHARKEKLKKEAGHNKFKQNEYEEAENDYKEFKDNFNQTKKEKIYELTEIEKQELKKNYLKASKICHPDVVSEDLKKEAEKIFIELKQAYDRNDLHKVNEILKNLEKGIFVSKTFEINEKEKLRSIVNRLRMKRDELIKAVNELKNFETYRTITEIENWDKYFEETKEKLQTELNILGNGNE